MRGTTQGPLFAPYPRHSPVLKNTGAATARNNDSTAARRVGVGGRRTEEGRGSLVARQIGGVVPSLPAVRMNGVSPPPAAMNGDAPPATRSRGQSASARRSSTSTCPRQPAAAVVRAARVRGAHARGDEGGHDARAGGRGHGAAA